MIYFNLDKILFIDVDALKKLKFNIVIYYIKHEKKYRAFNNKLLVTRENMKSILFFSKCLIDTKRWYWFIELKIVDLIWLIHRIKYIIKTSIKSLIIFYELLRHRINYSTNQIIVVFDWQIKSQTRTCFNLFVTIFIEN